MLKLGLKLAASAVLLTVILSRIDLAAMSHTIAGADPAPLLLAAVLSLAMFASDAMLWRGVLQALGHRIGFRPALLYAVSGTFFGNVGPATVGADVFRATQMRRLGVSTDEAVRAVVCSRLVSLVSLLAIIFSGMQILAGFHIGGRNWLALLSIFALALILLIGVLIVHPIRRRWPGLGRIALVRQAADLSADLSRSLTSRSQTPTSLLAGATTHLLRVCTFAAIAWALHAKIGLAPLYALIPVSLLVAMIPISFGNWGVREASLIVFLGWVGVPAAVALAISVSYGLLRLVLAVVGGLVWTLSRSHHYSLEVAQPRD